MLSLCRKVAAPVLLAALVIVQGLVYAGPCYQRSGGNKGCLAQGGPDCDFLEPYPSLPCPGTWTAADMAEQGLDPGWECRIRVIDVSIPKKNATSGNEADGFMEQGNFPFACTRFEICSVKDLIQTPPYVGPIWVTCGTVVWPVCTTYYIFTAGGAACPESSR